MPKRENKLYDVYPSSKEDLKIILEKQKKVLHRILKKVELQNHRGDNDKDSKTK